MRPGTVAAIGACVLAGCATGEGLLIEVVADPDIPSPVGAIDVWVGEPGGVGAATFLRLPAAGDIQAVDAWPFQILVEPDSRPRTVWVGAFGYADTGAVGGAPVAMGTIAAPVDVVPGELRFATLTLHRYFAPDADCLFDASVGLAIVPPDRDVSTLDCDDDGETNTDCNDLDPDVHPGAPEACDGIDNDCNGVCDDGLDADGDGYSRCTYADCAGPTCFDGSQPAVDLVGSCDCDDANPLANPFGVEDSTACDGVDSDCDPATGSTPTSPGEVPANQIDDDCDGVCDIDADGDVISAEPPGDPLGPGTWATNCDVVRADCADDNAEEYPNALERCDGVDNDCDPNSTAMVGACFVPTPAGCQLGARTCGEASGELGWTPCLTSSVASLSDETCATWALVEDDPWPEQVWYEMTGDDRRDTCTLDAWRPPDGGGVHVNQLCDAMPMTHLHPAFLFEDGCTTQIVGGATRGGYVLELHDRATDQRGPSVAGCDVDLVVKAVDGVGQHEVRLPSIWLLVLQTREHDGGTDTDVLPVEIRVRYADESSAFACPAGRWFDCD